MNENTVVIHRMEKAVYPSVAPFHPGQNYPEYAFGAGSQLEENLVYEGVRESMRLAGLDKENYGTPAWNPLGEYVKPGQFVLLKPNFVKEVHPRDANGWVYTITHGSVIRAVADYVWKALQGQGRLMVADAPQTDSSFRDMMRILELDKVQEFYRENGLDLELVDLRKEEWINQEEVIVERRPLPGDPLGYVELDLGDKSEFAQHKGAGRYYGADYDSGEVNRHHSGGRHEYLVAGTAIHCDVFINLPKLKTHKKTGVTINLKNLVGVNGDKNWLPHHTVGSPRTGGDQFPDFTTKQMVEHYGASALRKIALVVPGVGTQLLKRARRAGKNVFGDNDKTIRSGNWHGNDTTWRMALDLNKLVLFGNADGTFRPAEAAQRKTYLTFVDGVIAGEGSGPADPDPVNAGLLLFGSDPTNVDAAAAVAMGFDPEKIPLIRQSYQAVGFPVATGQWKQVNCLSNYGAWNGSLEKVYSCGDLLAFRPHFGWTGHIENVAAHAEDAAGAGSENEEVAKI